MKRWVTRALAVDWSGAKAGAERRIWLAEVSEEGLRRVERGRSREQIAEHLCEEARRDPRFVVGLDFAFSFPRWFLDHHGCGSAEELWRLARREGSRWSEELDPPFFDRGSWNDDWNRRFRYHSPYRKTDLDVPLRPETVFRLMGQRQVGKASLTGLPVLLRLREAGFSIWPFDPPSYPMAFEIYPRLFYGRAVKKSDQASRRAFVDATFPSLSPKQREQVTVSDDAFDAAVSALSLYRYRERFESIERETDPLFLSEGRIWTPEAQLQLSIRSGAETFSGRLAEAFATAVRLHGGQVRKGSPIPYISHLMAVTALVLEQGGSEEEAIGALLHDAAEDQGGAPVLEEIQHRFGRRVAELVRGCSDSLESPKAPWRERKEAFLERLPSASDAVLNVVLADKVHNAGSLVRDLEREGNRAWRHFSASPEETLWYYVQVADCLRRRPDPRRAPQLAELEESIVALGRRSKE